MPDIDEKELQSLTKARELLDKLLKSPETKRATEQQIKKLFPDTVISDDFDAPIRNEIKAVGEKLDKFLEGQRNNAEDARLTAAFDQLRKDGGYTDEGIEKIQALMKERNNADPFAAAALYDKLNPPPKPQQPSSFAGTSWGFGAKSDDVDTKLLFDDEDQFAEREAIKWFNEQAAKQ